MLAHVMFGGRRYVVKVIDLSGAYIIFHAERYCLRRSICQPRDNPG